MTLEQSPSNLPNDYGELLQDTSVVILVDDFTKYAIDKYVICYKNESTVLKSKTYNLANLTLMKMWELVGTGPISHEPYKTKRGRKF